MDNTTEVNDHSSDLNFHCQNKERRQVIINKDLSKVHFHLTKA